MRVRNLRLATMAALFAAGVLVSAACGSGDAAPATSPTVRVPTATAEAPAPTAKRETAPPTAAPDPTATSVSGQPAPTAIPPTAAPAQTALPVATPTSTRISAPPDAPTATVTPVPPTSTPFPTATPVPTFNLSVAGQAVTGTTARGDGGGALSLTPAPNAPGNKYRLGTMVTFTPLPDPDFDLLFWSGACTGAVERCSVTITADVNVNATFIRLPAIRVNDVHATGGTIALTSGTIIVSPVPNASAARYRAGTKVTLTALPTAGYAVLSWGGACAGSVNVCEVIADSDKNLRVTFAQVVISVNGRSVDSNLIAVTGGLVNVSPAPDAPAGRFTAGNVVTLTAQPNPGMKFKAWTGACAGVGEVCKLTMDGAKQVTVEFIPL